jgi:integrase
MRQDAACFAYAHDLRHTTASLLVKRGIHAKVIQSILGHARFAITMDLYSHLMDGAHEGAAEALDNLLSGQ